MYTTELDDLILQTGQDIAFWQGRLVIHQPTLKEIAAIGEETFWTGCQILNFDKDLFIPEKDKDNLEAFTDFDIFMSIMNDTKNANSTRYRVSALLVLTLMFPDSKIDIEKDRIIFSTEDNRGEINADNFNIFKRILKKMAGLSNGKEEYNPMGEMSKKIAEKIKRAQQKKAELKEDNGKFSVINRYISILTVGEQKNMNDFNSYTVYQLLDEFQRYVLYVQYDVHLKAQLAGATNLEDVDDWMKDLHP